MIGWKVTPLFLAVKNSYEVVVKLLLVNDSINMNFIDTYVRSLLVEAVLKSYRVIVKLLLMKDNINLNSGYINILLSCTIIDNNEVIVKLLLEANANINVKGIQGERMLTIAVYYECK